MKYLKFRIIAIAATFVLTVTPFVLAENNGIEYPEAFRDIFFPYSRYCN